MDQAKRKEQELPSSQAFPTRLFTMLEESQKRGFEDVICWQPGGESFRVFKPDRFAAEIASDFFALRKYKSFLRQLNIYGFQRIHHGPNKGGYCHSLFKRSKPGMCKLISRQGDSQRAPASVAANAASPKAPKGLKRSAESEESLFEEEVRARYKDKLDASVLDPVRLLFSLGSATRSISVASRVTNCDSSSGGTANPNDDHSSYDTLNSTALHLSKEPEHSFPWKLHTLLEEAEREGFHNIASWVEDGSAFKVHDSDAFVSTIMPNFFDQSKYESFRRQLNLYGFTRVTRGLNKGFISHPSFMKGDRSLCKRITRKGKDDGGGKEVAS